MRGATQMVLTAVGVALLVAVIPPAFSMSAMMGSMGGALVWWFWLPVLVLAARGVALAAGSRYHA